MMMLECFLLAALMGPSGAPTNSPDADTAPGAVIEDFRLSDIHRRSRRLSDYSDCDAVVVLFTGTECPIANLYVDRLRELAEQYEGRVQFLAVNANPQDSFVEVAAHANEYDLPFPVLKDFDQSVAKQFGAERTPEVFVLDSEQRLRYRGRIDDQYDVSTQRVSPRSRDLATALEQVLAGEPVGMPRTDVAGCLITYRDTPAVSRPVTWHGDVRGIVAENCRECHLPGRIGPFAMLDLDEVRGWSEAIREAVLEERMPPWHADPRFGEFSNHRELDDRDRDLILAWIDQGCPEGTAPAEAEDTAAVGDAGWTIGEPAMIFTMPETESVPASGVIPYKYYVVDPGFEEDVWVRAAEARPGNREVVHHIVVYLQEPGKPRFARDGSTSLLVGWAPGDMPSIYPDGVARHVPAGTQLIFEMHYTPNGKATEDLSSVGIILEDGPPEQIVETNILADFSFEIPPGVSDHQETARYTLPRDAEVLSFMPHMHWRGLRAWYEAEYPDGRRETLLSIPDYDFNWQSVYRFREPLRFPAGTTLIFHGVWDNSADNPRNPDPERAVSFGEQTWDEMLNGWVDLVWTENEE